MALEKQNNRIHIWFNHWFSTAYHLIHLMRQTAPDKLWFIGSGKSPLSVVRNACDAWFQEPEDCDAETYLTFCLDFCREHAVDVFVPRRFLPELSQHAADFAAIGVKLLANCDADLIRTLDQKIDAYAYFADIIPQCIPAHAIVHNTTEFAAAYERLKAQHEKICYKLVSDEGARSFRILDDTLEDVSAVLERPGNKIMFKTALRILEQYDFSVPLLMMPFLEGPEISADCLMTAQGNVIIPRYKIGGRYSEVRFEPEILALCETMLAKMQLPMPLNIQFRMHEGTPYFLEVNPRMSGGLQLSCMAAGCNLPAIALHKLLGWELPPITPVREQRTMTFVETPLALPKGVEDETAI